MANSDLYGKTTYRVPDGVLADIRMASQKAPGNQRAQHLLANPSISYANAKKIKQDLEKASADSPEYALAGGKSMLDWLNRMLSHDRSEVVNKKTIRSNSGFENQFRKTHERKSLKATDFNVSRLKPEIPKSMGLFETTDASTEFTTAIGVIINPELKFLLMKRADNDDWMPGKWALPGGGIEKGESIPQALTRELKEEAGLTIKHIQSDSLIVRHDADNHCAFLMAVCLEPGDMKIDPTEHSDAKWITEDELGDFDCVPNVKENVAQVRAAYKKDSSQK